jgi:hypothetical protein
MRTIVVKDDLDHALDADETIELTIDGVTYTLDLCKANAAKLRTALKKWLEAAHDSRKVKPPKKGDTAQAERRKAIREWGKANGYVINRGQLSKALIEAYDAANS